MKTMNAHPDSDDLELYLLKRLSDSKEQNVEEHLLVCDQCNEAVDRLLQEIRELQENLKLAA